MKEALPQDDHRPDVEADPFVLRSRLLRRLKYISQAINNRVRRLIESDKQPQADESRAESP